MIETKDKWPAVRIFHLAGGDRATDENRGKLKFFPEATRDQGVQAEISSYMTAYRELESLGLEIYGVDFYYHSMHASGGIPPEWRPYHRVEDEPWLVESTIQKWRGIANAAFKRKDGFLWDITGRIAYQLRTVTWRLREVSEAYHNQVIGIIQRSDFKDGTQIMDGFTELVNMALQGFLVDACILRDYLAEFLAVIFEVNGFEKTPVTTMKRLIKHLDKLPDGEKIVQQLKAATRTNGWINKLSSYRNLVVHSAPLGIAHSKIFTKCEELKVGGKGFIPGVRYFLPKDPEMIQISRSQGLHFSDFSKQLEVFAQFEEEQDSTLDGMDYAHSVLGKISELAMDLGQKSPLAAEQMVFDKLKIKMQK